MSSENNGHQLTVLVIDASAMSMTLTQANLYAGKWTTPKPVIGSNVAPGDTFSASNEAIASQANLGGNLQFQMMSGANLAVEWDWEFGKKISASAMSNSTTVNVDYTLANVQSNYPTLTVTVKDQNS